MSRRNGIIAAALLVAAVGIGFAVWHQRSREASEPADGGEEAAAEAGSSEGGTTDGEATAVDSEGGGEARTASDAGAGAIPDDPEACRAYCVGLFERGDLGEGVTAEGCAAEVCRSPAGSDGGAIPTMANPPASESGGDCRARCRRLQQAGELAQGVTLEACYAALCGDGGAE